MLQTIIPATVGACAWIAALIGPARLWWRGKRATGIIALILFVQGFTFLLLTRQAVDRFSGLVPSEPNVGILVRDAAGMILAWSVQILVLRTAAEPEERAWRARWRTGLLLIVLIAMAGTFLPAFHDVGYTADYIQLATALPLLQAYIVLYEAYFMVAVWDIGILSWRVAQVSGRRHVRVGMRCLTGSAVFAFLYILSMFDKLQAVSSHRALQGWESVDSDICVAIAGVLLITGLITPGIGATLGAAADLRMRRSHLRRLRPLAELVGLPEQRVPWLISEEGVESVRAAIADHARELLPWCDPDQTPGTNLDEPAFARILQAAAQARQQGRPRGETAWSMPGWFGDIERLCVVADHMHLGDVTATASAM